MDARLEVAIPGKHGDDAQVFLAHRGLDLGTGERARVADASRAPVADEEEAELLERLEQAGRLEVVGHHARPGRQACLDVGAHCQAELHRLLGQQAGRDHHRRVGSVGAARDRRDDDRSVLHLRLGLGVYRDRGAAVDRSALFGEARDRFRLRFGPGRQDGREAAPHVGERDSVLRALRSGDARLDLAQVEL